VLASLLPKGGFAAAAWAEGITAKARLVDLVKLDADLDLALANL
jgi:hypothetical protein